MYSRLLATTLAALLLSATLLDARIPDRMPQGPLRYLPGTLIIKLRPELPNRRDGALFGIPSLDNVLRRLGVDRREAMFPLAPWTSGEMKTGSRTPSGAETRFDHIYTLHYTAEVDAV